MTRDEQVDQLDERIEKVGGLPTTVRDMVVLACVDNDWWIKELRSYYVNLRRYTADAYGESHEWRLELWVAGWGNRRRFGSFRLCEVVKVDQGRTTAGAWDAILG